MGIKHKQRPKKTIRLFTNLRLWCVNLLAPPVLVLESSGLDALEGVEQQHNARAIFFVRVGHRGYGMGCLRVLVAIRVLVLDVSGLSGDALDGHQRGGRSCGHDLVKAATLLESNGAHLNLPTKVLCDLLHTR